MEVLDLLLLHGTKMQQPAHLGLPFAAKKPPPAPHSGQGVSEERSETMGRRRSTSPLIPVPAAGSGLGDLGAHREDTITPPISLLVSVAMSSPVLKLVHA